MNGWWLYLLVGAALAAPVIGMLLRRRLLRSQLGPDPDPGPDPGPHEQPRMPGSSSPTGG